MPGTWEGCGGEESLKSGWKPLLGIKLHFAFEQWVPIPVSLVIVMKVAFRGELVGRKNILYFNILLSINHSHEKYLTPSSLNYKYK